MSLIECWSVEAIQQNGAAVGWPEGSTSFDATGAGIRGNRLGMHMGFQPHKRFRQGSVLGAAGQSVVWGFAHTVALGNLHYFTARRYDGIGFAFRVYITSTGAIGLHNSFGQTVASGTGTPYAGGGWHFTEIKFSLSATSTFSVAIRRNGVFLFDTIGTIDFQGDSSLSILDFMHWSGGSAYVQDFYWLNTAGSVNNDYLGDCRVEHLTPSAVGAHDAWEANTTIGKVTSVASQDGDNYYIRTTEAGARQTFTMTDLASTSGVVSGVMVGSAARGEINGDQKVGATVRTGGTSHDSANSGTVAMSYTLPGRGVFDINPATGAPWTAAEINALEAGPLVVA